MNRGVTACTSLNCCPLPLSVLYCTGYQKLWATNNTLTFGCKFSSYKTETQLISAGPVLDDYILAECLMSLYSINLLLSSTNIHSQTVAKKPASTSAGCAILLNLAQFLDHVEKPMNNLYPNSGRDRSCSPESLVPFSPAPVQSEKREWLASLHTYMHTDTQNTQSKLYHIPRVATPTALKC